MSRFLRLVVEERSKTVDIYPETRISLSELPDTLKWLRKMRRLTLREVAESTGLSISFLSDIERGRTQPSITTLQKLTQVYNGPLLLAFEVE